ncbi:MAG: universal stress protein [Deltaproteobacteria bacterium]|nr:universal stress protein [Deltaproteobacteria bacterium]
MGKAADIIIAQAVARKGTLIAMATHGRSGLRRWLLGSVAEKVLRLAGSHVMLARPTEAVETRGLCALKSILVTLDGSRLAESALPCAVALAKKMDLEVTLLRVYALPVSAYLASEERAWNYVQLVEQSRDEARAYLEKKVQELDAAGLKKVFSLAVEGNAAAEIIELARKSAGTLITMCTHGRSGVGRWLLGSVTERVVRHGENPVLVVRPAQQRR